MKIIQAGRVLRSNLEELNDLKFFCSVNMRTWTVRKPVKVTLQTKRSKKAGEVEAEKDMDEASE